MINSENTKCVNCVFRRRMCRDNCLFVSIAEIEKLKKGRKIDHIKTYEDFFGTCETCVFADYESNEYPCNQCSADNSKYEDNTVCATCDYYVVAIFNDYTSLEYCVKYNEPLKNLGIRNSVKEGCGEWE